MNNLIDECFFDTSDKIKVLSENRSRMELVNNSGVIYRIVKVDGCQISDDSNRCDYAAIIKDVEYYIELKGENVKKAVDQLKATINRLSEDAKRKEKKSFVISSRSPLSSTDIQIVQKAMKKNYNSSFTVKNRQHAEVF